MRGDRFYIGAPCAYGHSGKRYVAQGACYECQMLTGAKRDSAVTRQSRKMYKAANRDRVHAGNARREAQIAETKDGSITGASVACLLSRQHGLCAYCISPAEHLDHKTPLSRDGRHVLSNVHWLCASCNLSKGAMTDGEYRIAKNVL